MRLTLPSSVQENGLTPLFSTLEELELKKNFQNYSVENVALNFSFINKQNPEKSIPVSCSLSKNKSSLCPLFPYDRYARSLLKLSGIDNGFVENIKKEKDDVAKKWQE